MLQRRDDVARDGRTVAQVLMAVREAEATVEVLWEALFKGLARKAGLPPPTVRGAVASYVAVEEADALAAYARQVFDVAVLRFDFDASDPDGERHCVSVCRF